MKKIFVLPSLVACLSTSALAAGPVANIQVTGDIKPPTCTVNGGDNDLVYSFGNISPSVIPQNTTYNSLPSLSNNLTVTCDADTFLTFKATDNYPNGYTPTPGMNVNYESALFNLVSAEDTTKTIGGIIFIYSNILVDGKTQFLSKADDAPYWNGTWGGSFITIGATTGFTSIQQANVALSDLSLISGKEFSFDISNRVGEYMSTGVGYTIIHSKTMLANNEVDITNGLDYLGQAILTFSFGV
ncbi:type 1 fimbria pilin [Providencia alcalifaciens]|nr:type 1 fimbria pilin [Providencia alcalifaciens]